jgi:hypothetical protein
VKSPEGPTTIFRLFHRRQNLPACPFAAGLMPRNAGAGLREALQMRQSNFIDREAARRTPDTPNTGFRSGITCRLANGSVRPEAGGTVATVGNTNNRGARRPSVMIHLPPHNVAVGAPAPPPPVGNNLLHSGSRPILFCCAPIFFVANRREAEGFVSRSYSLFLGLARLPIV